MYTMRIGRKVIGHEVREVKAARVNTSVTEQLKQEQMRRQTLERSFVEMESVLKKRILYLEQYKAAVGNKMGHLQGRLDLSVPQEDYLVRTCVRTYVCPYDCVWCVGASLLLTMKDLEIFATRYAASQDTAQYYVTPQHET